MNVFSKDTLTLVLAGGQSRRMGGRAKWQLVLGEHPPKPLLTHIVERLSPQTSHIVLNGNHPDLATYGLPVISDVSVDEQHNHFQGPLAGLLTGLLYAEQQGIPWLVTCPCDTPFIPMDYIEQLCRTAQSSDMVVNPQCIISTYQARIHPICGLWSTQLIPNLRDTLRHSDTRSVQQWLRTLEPRVCYADFTHSSTAHAFININTPEDWETAQAFARF